MLATTVVRWLDKLHLKHPFAGSRMLHDMLQREGFEVGHKHVGTLMTKMGVQPLYRKPNTSKKHPGHAVYPYLLRGKKIDRANEVWARSDLSEPHRAKMGVEAVRPKGPAQHDGGCLTIP